MATVNWQTLHAPFSPEAQPQDPAAQEPTPGTEALGQFALTMEKPAVEAAADSLVAAQEEKSASSPEFMADYQKRRDAAEKSDREKAFLHFASNRGKYSDDEKWKICDDFSRDFFGFDTSHGAGWTKDANSDGRPERSPFATPDAYADTLVAVLDKGYTAIASEDYKRLDALVQAKDRDGIIAMMREKDAIEQVNEEYETEIPDSPSIVGFIPGGKVRRTRKVDPSGEALEKQINAFISSVYAENYVGIYRAMSEDFDERDREIVKAAVTNADGLPPDMSKAFRNLIRANPDKAARVKFLIDQARDNRKGFWRDAGEAFANTWNKFGLSFEYTDKGLQGLIVDLAEPMAVKNEIKSKKDLRLEMGRNWSAREQQAYDETYANLLENAPSWMNTDAQIDWAQRQAMEAAKDAYAGRMAEQYSKKRYELRRDRMMLEDALAHRQYSGYGWFKRGAIGAIGTLPYMGMALVPYAGFSSIAAEEFQSSRDEAIANGEDPDEALGLRAVTAVAYAGLERLEALGFIRPTSALRKAVMVRRIASGGGAGRLANLGKLLPVATKDAVVNTLNESLQEGLQSGVEALRDAIIDEKTFDTALRETFSAGAREFGESISTMGILSAAGAPIRTARAWHYTTSGSDLADFCGKQLQIARTLAGLNVAKPDAATNKKAAEAYDVAAAIWDKHKDHSAALEEIRDRFGLTPEQTMSVADVLDARDLIVEDAKRRGNTRAAEFLADVAGGKFPVGQDTTWNPEALYNAVLSGAKVEWIDDMSSGEAVPVKVDTPAAEAATGEAAPAGPSIPMEDIAETRARYEDMLAEAEQDYANAPDAAARHRAHKHLAHVRARLKTLRKLEKAREAAATVPESAAPAGETSPAPESAPADTGAEAQPAAEKPRVLHVTLPFGGEIYVREDTSAPDVDSESFAVSVANSVQGDPTLTPGADVDPGTFLAMSAEEKIGVAVTPEQYMAMSPDERRGYLRSHNLAAGGGFAVTVKPSSDSSGTLEIPAKGVASIKRAVGEFVRRGGNWTLAHEHTHAIIELGRAMGAISDAQMAALRRLFGEARHSREEVNEEGIADAFPQWLRGKFDFAALRGAEHVSVRNLFRGMWNAVKALFTLRGEAAPAAEVDRLTIPQAREAVFEAIRTGDLSGLPVESGIDFGDSDKNPTQVRTDEESRVEKQDEAARKRAEQGKNPAQAAIDRASRTQSAPPPERKNAPATAAQEASPIDVDAAEAAINAAPEQTVANMPRRAGGTRKISTPNFALDVEVEPMWVPLASLIESTDDHSIQNRDRSRRASDAQVLRNSRPRHVVNPATGEMAGFNPRGVLPGEYSDRGAFIVGGGSRIVAGHGRKLILETLASEGRFGEYLDAANKWAKENGYSAAPEGMENPVIVYRLVGNLSRAQLEAIATFSNQDSKMAFSPAETAENAAAAITPALMRLYNPGASGSLLAVSNHPFMRAFLEKAVGKDEAARYTDADDRPTIEAAALANRALMTAIFGKSENVREMLRSLLERAGELSLGTLQRDLVKNAGRLLAMRNRHGAYDIALAAWNAAPQERFSIAAQEARKQYGNVEERYTNPDGTKKRGWMKAPNGQPTKLSERQWVQVRTPAFKAWFGEWESDAELAPSDMAGAKSSFRALMSQNAEIRTADGATLRFVSQSAKAYSKEAEHESSSKTAHWAALANIEGLVARSRFMFEEKPRNGSPDIEAYVKYGTVFTFGGEKYLAKITSKRYAGRGAQNFYSVESVSVEKIDARGIHEAIAKGQPLDASDVDRISNILSAGNGEDAISSKVVDENGEPLVVWHGDMDPSFSAFDKEKIQRGTGFWFAKEQDEAAGYALDAEPRAFYLDIKNPAREADLKGRLLAEYHANGGAGASWKAFISDRQAADFLRSRGYDGLEFEGKYIAFEPSQIKSATDNSGAFGENPDVRFSVAGIYTYNPRSNIPNVRGGWNEKKILRYLKANPSLHGVRTAARLISEFDTVDELKDHMFYHGTRNYVDKMQPSMTQSERWAQEHGGGGYGQRYWGISVSKSKKVASIFGNPSPGVSIYPVVLAKSAKVIDRPDLTDAADVEDHIVELWNDDVDAVRLGDWKSDYSEQELLVLNPRAICNIGTADSYRYFGLGSDENPLDIKDDAHIARMLEAAREYADYSPVKRFGKPVRPSLFYSSGTDGTIGEMKPREVIEAEKAQYEKDLAAWQQSEQGIAAAEYEWKMRDTIRYSVSPVYTGTAADYANRSRQGGVDDGPSLLKIGTGEGAQVYGWGLYGSTVRGVAEVYAKRDAWTGKALKTKSGLVKANDDTPENLAAGYIVQFGDRAEIHLQKDANNELQGGDREASKRYKDAMKAAKNLRKKGFEIVDLKPHLYEQTFFTDRAPGDERHLLKWYEPVSKENIKRVLDQYAKEHDGADLRADTPSGTITLEDFGDRKLFADALKENADALKEDGASLYRYVSGVLGSEQAASEFLARAGIDGMKYPVDSFGGKGVKNGDEAGWNYVSFRDDNIRVDHKWTDGQMRYSVSVTPEVRKATTVDAAEATLEKTKAALAALAGKPLINDETKIEAWINDVQARKIVSNKAVAKSEANGFTKAEHNAAAAIIETLWKYATLGKSAPDRDGDPNIRSVKRFVSPVFFRNGEGKKDAYAYITAKESVEHGHRIYSIEIEKLEALGKRLDRSQALLPNAPSEALAGMLGGLNHPAANDSEVPEGTEGIVPPSGAGSQERYSVATRQFDWDALPNLNPTVVNHTSVSNLDGAKFRSERKAYYALKNAGRLDKAERLARKYAAKPETQWLGKYLLAKYHADTKAAAEIVKRIVKPSVIDELKAALDPSRPVVAFFPMASKESNSLNRLPLHYAKYLAKALHGRVERRFKKLPDANNTNARANERAQREFKFKTSDIDLSDNPQIVIVDDVWTSGQTVASAIDAILAQHPEADIRAVTTLAVSRYGKTIKPTQERLTSVLKKSTFADAAALERQLGYDIRHATDSELQAYILHGKPGASGIAERFGTREGTVGNRTGSGDRPGAGRVGRDIREAPGTRAVAGRETPEARASVRRGPDRRREYLASYLAAKILAGAKPDVELADKTARAMNIPGDGAGRDALESAQRIADMRRAGAQKAVDAKDPNLMRDLMSAAVADRVQTAFQTVFAGGARGADPDAGREVERAIQRAKARDLATANGFTAAELAAELPVSLVDAIFAVDDYLRLNPDKRAPRPDEASLDAQEQADVAAVEATGELPPPRALTPDERAAVESLLDLARQSLAATRAAEADAKAARDRRAEERAAAGDEGDAVGDPAAGGDADLDSLPDILVERVAPVFDSPDLFAHFILEWATPKILAAHPHLPATGEMWKSPVAVRDLKRTVVSVLRQLSTDALGSPGISRARNEVDHLINGLEEPDQYVRKSSILRRVAAIYARLHDGALALDRRHQMRDLERYLRHGAIEKGRMSAIREDLKRKVTAAMERRARNILAVINLSEDALAEEEQRLEGIIDAYNTESADSSFRVDDMQAYHDAADKLAVLRVYGGMKRWMPGRIADAVSDIHRQFDGEIAAQEQRRAEQDARTQAFRDALIAAMRQGAPSGIRTEGVFDRFARAQTGQLTLQLQNLLRYCTDQGLLDEALRQIDLLKTEISHADALATNLKGNASREIHESLAQIYGSAPAGIRHLLSEEIPEADDLAIFRDRTMRHTYGHLLQLYGSIIQRDYSHNFDLRLCRIHGIAPDDATPERLAPLRRVYLDRILSVLTPQDIQFHRAAVAWYQANRDTLSAAVEQVTGLAVRSPDPMYIPVRPATEPSGFSASARAWSPIPSALNRRIRHSLDFSERANILALMQEQCEVRAQTIGYSQLGLLLRDTVAHRDVQRAAAECVSRADIREIVDHARDILMQYAAAPDANRYLRGLDLLRSWTARVALSGNIFSGFKQIASFSVWANATLLGEDVGVGRVLRYMLSAATAEGRQAIRELIDSDHLRARYTMGWSPETASLLQHPPRTWLGRAAAVAARLGMSVNSFVDRACILWMAQGFYRDATAKFLAMGMDEATAKQRALDLTWATAEEGQQSGRVTNLNSGQRNSPLVRLLTQFRSASILQNAYVISAWQRRHQPGGKARLIRALLTTFVAIPSVLTLVQALQRWSLGDEPPEDEDAMPQWVADFITNCLAGAISPYFYAYAVTQVLCTQLGLDGNARNSADVAANAIPAMATPIRVAWDGSRLVIDAAKLGAERFDIIDLDDALDLEQLQRDAHRLLSDLLAPYRHAARAWRNYSEAQ